MTDLLSIGRLSEEERDLSETLLAMYRKRIAMYRDVIMKDIEIEATSLPLMITNYLLDTIRFHDNKIGDDDKRYLINLFFNMVEIAYGAGVISGMNIDKEEEKQYPVWNDKWDNALDDLSG